eukprot:g10580.t1
MSTKKYSKSSNREYIPACCRIYGTTLGQFGNLTTTPLFVVFVWPGKEKWLKRRGFTVFKPFLLLRPDVFDIRGLGWAEQQKWLKNGESTSFQPFLFSGPNKTTECNTEGCFVTRAFEHIINRTSVCMEHHPEAIQHYDMTPMDLLQKEKQDSLRKGDGFY